MIPLDDALLYDNVQPKQREALAQLKAIAHLIVRDDVLTPTELADALRGVISHLETATAMLDRWYLEKGYTEGVADESPGGSHPDQG